MAPRYASSETNRVGCGLGDFMAMTCYEEEGQPEQGAELLAAAPPRQGADADGVVSGTRIRCSAGVGFFARL